MNYRVLFLLAMLLPVTLPAHADDMVLEIIPLQHRMVSDVISIIGPLVAEGGTVTGMNNQLIVKTTPDNLEEIKQVLASIDQSPRRLMISVKQDIGSAARMNKSGISGSYTSGDIHIEGGERRPHGDVVIRGGDGDGNSVQYQAENRQSTRDDANVFRVQTLEGNPAYINVGQSIPVPEQTTYVTPGGVVVQEGISYYDAGSGFYVVPRLQGDQVTLLCSPWMSATDPRARGSFDFQNIETSASGRLGEWIQIGGVDRSFRDGSGHNLGAAQRQGQEHRTVLIKVDEIR